MKKLRHLFGTIWLLLVLAFIAVAGSYFFIEYFRVFGKMLLGGD